MNRLTMASQRVTLFQWLTRLTSTIIDQAQALETISAGGAARLGTLPRVPKKISI